jgi:hypothetical protein
VQEGTFLFPFLNVFGVVEVCGARCRHYVQEGTFLLDVATLLPLDILYIWLGTGTPTNLYTQ